MRGQKEGLSKLENYREVIAKYKDVDLYGMTDEEYKELKAAELADMQTYVDAISASTVPEVNSAATRPCALLRFI